LSAKRLHVRLAVSFASIKAFSVLRSGVDQVEAFGPMPHTEASSMSLTLTTVEAACPLGAKWQADYLEADVGLLARHAPSVEQGDA
jgi:hypothetical protein